MNEERDPWKEYQKIKVVGRGAHGVAILCRRRKDSSHVVVKEVYQEEVSVDDREVSNSMNEIRLLSMLRHDNILAYYDSFRAVASAEGGMTGGDAEKQRENIGKTEDKNGNNESKTIRAVNLIKTGESAESAGDDGSGEDVSEPTSQKNLSEGKEVDRRRVKKEEDGEEKDMALMIVMEYADGGTLDDYLRQHFEKGTSLDEKEVLNLFSQLALALHHIHSCNILHRDLKTTNILISGSGNSKVLKIGDFGISKQLGSKSKADTVVGTPSYISPELCEGKPYDHKSDVWALGCILYEMAMLKRLFEASNLLALVLKIMRGSYDPLSSKYSPQLADLLKSLINLNPSKRPDMTAIISMPFLQRHIVDAQMNMGRVDPATPRKSSAGTGSSSTLVMTSRSTTDGQGIGVG